MSKTRVLAIALLAIMLLLFTGCDNDSAKKNYMGENPSTDNSLAVNILVSNMLPCDETKKDDSILSSLKATISNDSFDFSEIAYSDDTVCIGDVVYIEGIIPKVDYPSDKVSIWSDPTGKVTFENKALTNKDGNTVLTFNVVGNEVGTTKVALALDDSDYYHSFDLEIIDSNNRSVPSYDSFTVYCTPTGGKYHSYGCGYLRGNGIAISLDEAIAKGLGPCSRCQY